MRRFLILCLMGLNGLTARAATTLPDLNATPATLPNGISVTGAVTLPAASIADAALSSNIPLKNAANIFTAAQTINAAGNTLTLGANTTLGTLALGNATNAFLLGVVSGVQTAGRTLTLPILTGADTAATLGLAQTFTATQTINAAAPSMILSDAAGTGDGTIRIIAGKVLTIGSTATNSAVCIGDAGTAVDVLAFNRNFNAGTIYNATIRAFQFRVGATGIALASFTSGGVAESNIWFNPGVPASGNSSLGFSLAGAAADAGLQRDAAGITRFTDGTEGGSGAFKATTGTLTAPVTVAGSIVTTDGTQTITNKSVDAGQLTGTVLDARLSSNIPLKNAANSFTAGQTINATAALTLQGGVNGGGDIRSPVNTSIRIGNTGTVVSALAIGNAASGQVGIGFNMDNSVGATSIYNSAIRAFQLYINSGSGIIMQTYTGAGALESNLYFNPGGSTNSAIGLSTDSGIQRDSAGVVRITNGTDGGSGALKATTGTFTAATNQLILGAAAGPNITVTAPAPVASRTLTIPDTGAAANFVMTQGAQTITGATTFASAVNITPTTNQIVFGVTSTTTISAIAPTASRIYTIDDVGGAAKFAMAANQGTTTTLLHGSATGVPSYLAVSLTADVTGILPTANGGTGIAYFTAAGPTVARVYTFPDAATTVLTTNSAVTTAQGGTGVATFTANGVLYGNAAGNVLVTAAGANNTLLHGNTGAAPTYSAVSMTDDVTGILPLANGGTNRTDGAPGAFIQTKILTSGTSFTTTANTRTIIIRVQGGGGGGGSDASVAAQNSAGGGGSAGGYAEKVFTVAGSTAYTYAIGAAGAGGTAGGSGSAGGASTFTVGATTVTANGGLGGNGSASYAGVGVTLGGSSPAVSTNGDVNSGGAPGGTGFVLNATVVAVSGAGGSCIFGAGGNSVNAQGAGLAGVGNGAGGSGGVVVNGGAVTAGGAGLAGIITVDEYR